MGCPVVTQLLLSKSPEKRFTSRAVKRKPTFSWLPLSHLGRYVASWVEAYTYANHSLENIRMYKERNPQSKRKQGPDKGLIHLQQSSQRVCMEIWKTAPSPSGKIPCLYANKEIPARQIYIFFSFSSSFAYYSPSKQSAACSRQGLRVFKSRMENEKVWRVQVTRSGRAACCRYCIPF